MVDMPENQTKPKLYATERKKREKRIRKRKDYSNSKRWTRFLTPPSTKNFKNV